MRFFKNIRNVALVALVSVALQGQAQPPSLPQGWTLHTIREGKLYWVEGGGGSSTIIIGDTGVVVVDPKTTKGTGEALVKIVGDLTPKPITHLVQTHSDCDHVNGVVGFPPSVKVVAHVNNFIEQKQVLRFATVEVDGGYGLPPPDRLPNSLIVKNKVDTKINGIHLIFYNFGPSHTSGDLVVYLPDYKVVVAGDLLLKTRSTVPGLPPQNHGLWWKFEKNGSLDGWLKTAQALLDLDATTYIVGHGSETMTKAEIRERISGLRADRAKVEAMAESGKSLDEITTAMGDQKYPEMGLRRETSVRECPRGIGYMSAAWFAYHEWFVRNHEFK